MGFSIEWLDKTGGLSQARELYSLVFEDDERFTSYFFEQEAVRANTHILGGFADGRLVSMLFLREKTLSCKGKTMSGCYIYGVATAPKYRCKGYMGRLMETALEYIKSRRFELVYLVPTEENYYKKFGFVTVREKSFLPIGKPDGQARKAVRLTAGEDGLIAEAAGFCMRTESLRDEVVILKDISYLRHRLLQAQAENAGIYKVSDDSGSICSVVVTGTGEGDEVYVSQVVCREEKMRSAYAWDVINAFPQVRPFLRVYPIMLLEGGASLKVDINDEV